MSITMRACAKTTLRILLVGCLLGISMHTTSAQEDTQSANTDEVRHLDKDDLTMLQKGLDEMQSLAPKLRVLLRSLRKQVGIDSRELFTIERSISQTQTDLQRLISMHQRGAVNSMRAHFLADDMRRKADALHDSLAYLLRHGKGLREKAEGSLDEAVLKENADLDQQLGHYSQLLDQSVELLQARKL